MAGWRHALADIFEEVNEEVRKDQFSEVWQKYGKLIVAGATLALALSIGYVLWDNYQVKQQAESSAQFQQALQLIDAKKDTEANQVLAALVENGTAGYAVLARFRGAGIKAQAGENAAAAEIYDALAADSGIDTLYRDLARLFSVMQRIDDGDPAALEAELQPLLAPKGAWRYSARELAAIVALRQRNAEAAKTHFKALVDDAATPSGLRRRASEMLRAIDGS